MTTTPFRDDRNELRLSGRAFRTLITAGRWNMAACIASLDHEHESREDSGPC